MRIWLKIVCSLPLVISGCVSTSQSLQQHESPPDIKYIHFTPEETSLIKGLSNFAIGRLQSSDPEMREQAFASYQAALEAQPGNHALASRVAVSALQDGDFETAIDVLEQSYRFAPDEFRRVIDLAVTYQAANQPEQAAVYYRKALDIDPSATSATIALAGLLFEKQQETLALETLAEGYENANDPARIALFLSNHAQRQLIRGAIANALPYYELLKGWDEVRRPEIYLILAELYSSVERDQEAILALQEAIVFEQAPPEAFTALALLALRNDQDALAKETLGVATNRFHDTPEVLLVSGSLYAEGGHYTLAAKTLEKARETVRAAMEEGDEDPVFAEGFYLHLGGAYERMGKNRQAESVFKEGLSHYPESHLILNYLAYMWAEENIHIEKALSYSLRSLELQPDVGAYVDTLGWIQYRMNDFETAYKTISRARELDGDDPEILLHLGDIQKAKGNLEQAISYWKKSVREDDSEKNRAVEQLKQYLHPDPDTK